MRRAFLLVWLCCMGVPAVAEFIPSSSFTTVETEVVSIDTRTDFAGNLCRDSVSISVPSHFSAPVTFSVNDSVIASNLTGSSYLWDSSTTDDGVATLSLTDGVETVSRELLVYNSADVVFHEGRISSNENWGADKVHIITGDVYIPGPYTVTVAPGTVIKFCENVGIITEVSGRIIAEGEALNQTVFCSILDDAVAGDTNLDGDATSPQENSFFVKCETGGLGLTFSANTIFSGAKSVTLLPSITIKDVVYNENSDEAVVNLTLSGTNSYGVEVQWRTSDGTAISGSDYEESTGTVSWEQGTTGIREVRVPILADTVREDLSETFFVDLFMSGGAYIKDNRAVVTVIDNAPSAEFGAYALTESNGIKLECRDDFGGRLCSGSTTFAVPSGFSGNPDLSIASSVVGTGLTELSFPWDSSSMADGWTDSVLSDGVLELSSPLVVCNNEGVVFHDGRLSASETWSADKVHIVTGDIYIPDGITLTVAAGAVVKLCENIGIIVETGGTLDAVGDESNHTIFTTINDDSAGGDTNLDGSIEYIASNSLFIKSWGTVNFSQYTFFTDVKSVATLPYITIKDVVVYEGANESTVILTLTGTNSSGVTVQWRTRDGVALAGADYTATTGEVVWDVGKTGTKLINIPINRDDLEELPSEEFFVELFLAGGAYTVDNEASVTIFDNLKINSGIYGAAESNEIRLETRDDFGGKVCRGTVPFTILESLQNPLLSVSGSSVSLDGVLNQVYSWDSLSLADGLTDTTLTTDLENYTSELVVCNSLSVELHDGRLSASETWSADKTHVVTGDIYIPDGISLTVDSGTVVKFCDNIGIYVEAGGTLNAIGESENHTVFTSILDDSVAGDTNLDGEATQASGNLFFVKNWGTVTFNKYSFFSHTKSIATLPYLKIKDVVVNENSGEATVSVTLSGTNKYGTTVKWETSDGSALNSADYTFSSGELNWDANQTGVRTVTVPILVDSLQEFPSESFFLNLFLSGGAYISDPQSSVTIFDNAPPISSGSYGSTVSDLVRLETRQSFGGRLCTGEVPFSLPESLIEPDLTIAGSMVLSGGTEDSFSWDSLSAIDGWTDSSVSDGTTTLTSPLVVCNDPAVTFHDGRLLSNELWTADKLHIVTGDIYIPNGVTLTIQSGSTVKFCENIGIYVESGGTLNAIGNDQDGIIFCSVLDDSVGGDSNFDMDATVAKDDLYFIKNWGTANYSKHTYFSSSEYVAGLPDVSIKDVVVNENCGEAIVTLKLSGTNSYGTTVEWITSDNSASDVLDYTHSGGVVEWETNQTGTRTVRVPILLDGEREEPSESFFINLSLSGGAYISDNQAVIYIYDNLLPSGGDVIVGSTEFPATRLDTRTDFMSKIAGNTVDLSIPDLGGVTSSTLFVNDLAIEENLQPPKFIWETTGMEYGWQNLKLECYSDVGELVERFAATVLIFDGELHSGRVTENEVWKSGTIHLIDNSLIVASGVNLTIEPGAIVKFSDGAELTVEFGGVLIANGVTFTHIADDEAGGDTNMDGNSTFPQYDRWSIAGFGEIIVDSDTDFCYVAATQCSGTLTSSQTWFGNRVYHVTANLTVPSGVVLTLLPGAVVKFNDGCSLIVQSGGVVNANGNRTQPVTLTSIKDDSVGGDTNKDGNKTVPQSGDWVALRNTGESNFVFSNIRYGGYVSGTVPRHGSVGMLQANGGTCTVRNCKLSHSGARLIDTYGGDLTVENSIFDDSWTGVYQNGGSLINIYNSVFHDCSFALGAWDGNGSIYNSSFIKIGAMQKDRWNDAGGAVTWSLLNCSIWDADSVSFSGNYISENPMFRDAENGDFRLRAGSPLIDAGDGSVAPEFDFFGQPRVNDPHVADTGTSSNGFIPDIGIFEMTDNAESDIDLVVNWVNAPTTAIVGDAITIQYKITNIGTKAASGSWRDTVSFLLNGQSVVAGDFSVATTLNAGDSEINEIELEVPTLNKGDWYVQCATNSSRDIFEGRLIDNNVKKTVGTIAIDVPTLGMGGSITVAGNTLQKLSLKAGESYTITVPTECNIYARKGFVPDSDSHDWKSVTLANGTTVLTISDLSTDSDIYLLFEELNGEIEVSVVETALELFGVSSSTAANSGEVSLTVYGSGFTDNISVNLGSITGTGVAVKSSVELSATFNLAGAVIGDYDLQVSSGDESTTLAKAVNVVNGGIGSILEASLNIPDSVREGRVYTGYIEYMNSGDTDMLAPFFMLECDKGSYIWLNINENKINGTDLHVLGTATTTPAGVLKAGESHKVPFYFQASAVPSFKLSVVNGENQVKLPHFSTWEEYHQKLCDTASRLHLRGERQSNIIDISYLLLRETLGQSDLAISGVLLNSLTGNPVVGAEINATAMTNTLAGANCVTDSNGYFQLTALPSNCEYSLNISELGILAENKITVNETDVNDVKLFASIYATVSGVVTNIDYGAPELPRVLLYKDSNIFSSQAVDQSGNYSFTGLTEGDYIISVNTSGNHYAEIIPFTVASNLAPIKADISLKEGLIINGQVTDNLGEPISGVVVVYESDTILKSVETDINGDYTIFGIPEGEYSLSVSKEDYQDHFEQVVVDENTTTEISTLENERKIKALFNSAPVGTEIPFFLNEKYIAENNKYAWDFDGDDVVDSTDLTPVYRFMTTGEYSPEVTVTYADMTSDILVIEQIVEIIEPEETVVNENVVNVNDESSGLIGISKVDNTLILQQVGTLTKEPAIDSVIVVTIDEINYLEKVTAVIKNNDLFILTTESANLNDVFDSLSSYQVVELSDDDMQDAGFRRVSREGEEEDKWKLELKGGYTFSCSAEFKPKILFYTTKSRVLKKIETMHCSLNTEITVEVKHEVGVSGAFNYSDSKPIINFKSKPFLIGGVIPATIKPKFELDASLHLNGKTSWERSTTTTYLSWFGFDYEKGNGFRPFNHFGKSSSETKSDFIFQGGARLEAGVNVGAKLKIGKLSSLELMVGLYGFAQVKTSNKHNIMASAGVGGKITGEANLLDIEVGKFKYKLGVGGEVSAEWPLWEYHVPSPEFSPSIMSGVAPLQVDFSDKSSSGLEIIKWEWDFGDGATSEEQNPAHTFNEPGEYLVKLKVSGNKFVYDSTYEKTIHVKDDEGEDDRNNPAVPGRPISPPPIDSRRPGVPRSCDPNEMVGPVGFDDVDTDEDDRIVLPGQWMNYSIYFENKKDATAAAQEVFVKNPLSQWLDWETLELGEVVFNNQTEMGLAGKKRGSFEVDQNNSNYKVRVEFEMVDNGGEFADYPTAEYPKMAKWYLRSADPSTIDGWPSDPYAGFLPPNDDNPDDEGEVGDLPGEPFCGEGRVTYRVRLHEDAPIGLFLTNDAEIIFDYNAPIWTWEEVGDKAPPGWYNTVGVPPTGWEADESKAKIMTVIAQVKNQSGSKFMDVGYQLAAFEDGEVVGVETLTSSDESACYELTIYSDSEDGASLSFKTYNISHNSVFDIKENIEFVANSTLGSFDAPLELTALAVTGDQNADGNISNNEILALIQTETDSEVFDSVLNRWMFNANYRYSAIYDKEEEDNSLVTAVRTFMLVPNEINPNEILVNVSVTPNDDSSIPFGFVVNEQVPSGCSMVDDFTPIRGLDLENYSRRSGDSTSWFFPEYADRISFDYKLSIDDVSWTLKSFEGNIETTNGRSTIKGADEVINGTEREWTVKLDEGWNLISCPFPMDVNFKELYQHISTAWIWNTGYGSYELARSDYQMEVGKAFWVYSKEEQSITIIGDNISSATLVTNVGWNLLGVIKDCSIYDGEDALRLFEYSPTSGSYIQTESAEPGKGYWYFQIESGEIITPLN